MKTLQLFNVILAFLKKHQVLLSCLSIVVATSWSTFVCYSAPFPMPEEGLGINSRNAFIALVTGQFPASGARVNEAALISLVDYPIQLVVEFFGIKNHGNYLVKLCLRSAAAGLTVFGLLYSLSRKALSSLLAVLTVASTFFWITSVQYVPKITAITLLAGGMWLMHVSTISAKRRFMLAVVLAFGTLGILANLASAVIALLFFPVGISYLALVEKTSWRTIGFRSASISSVFVLVWTVPFWLGYLRGGSLKGVLAYSDITDYSLIGSTGILPIIVGSGYWAESIMLGPISIFGWVPRIGGVGFALRLILVLAAISVGAIIISLGTRIEKPFHALVSWSLTFWFFSIIITGTNASDWPLSELITNHSIFIAFREPWTKFMPVYLISLGILIAVILSQQQPRISVHRRHQLLCRAPIAFITVALFVFSLNLIQSQKEWANSTINHINKPNEWMLYDDASFTNYISSVRIISQLADASSVCVEFVPDVSDSLRRDMTALGQIYVDQRVVFPWNILSGRESAGQSKISCIHSNEVDDERPAHLVLFAPQGVSLKDYPEFLMFEDCKSIERYQQFVVYEVACLERIPAEWPA